MALSAGSQLPPHSQLPQVSIHLASNSSSPTCLALCLSFLTFCRQGGSCHLPFWHQAPLAVLARRMGPAVMDLWGKGTSGRMFWPYGECIPIAIFDWKSFCSADPFLGVRIVIMCAAARGGPSRRARHLCCMFSLLLKRVLVLLNISKPSLSLWTLTSNQGEFSNECS